MNASVESNGRTRPLRRGTAVAAALLVALVALTAPTPAAAVDREFYGVVPLDRPSDTDFRTLGRGGVGTMRLILAWPNVEIAPGARHWNDYDALFEEAALNGIRILPTLYGSTAAAAPRGSLPPASPAARAAWAQFVADAVARYGAGGAFWQEFVRQHPGSVALPPTYWQLWNEVNSPSFWTRRPTARSYVRLLKPTTAAIRAADPTAKVLLAGLFDRPGQKHAVPVRDYMDDLYRIKGVKRLFDAVSVHPYAKNPSDAMRAVRSMRRILRAHRDRNTSIWITELGWASSGIQTKFTKTPSEQAAHLALAFASLAASADRYRIAGVIWYSLRDSAAGEEWLYRSGLFGADGAPKPSWFSLLQLTGGSYQPGANPRPPGGAPSPPPPPPRPCPLPPLVC